MDTNLKLIKQYEKLEMSQADYILQQKSWHALIDKTEVETSRLLNLSQKELETKMKARVNEAQKVKHEYVLLI